VFTPFSLGCSAVRACFSFLFSFANIRVGGSITDRNRKLSLEKSTKTFRSSRTASRRKHIQVHRASIARVRLSFHSCYSFSDVILILNSWLEFNKRLRLQAMYIPKLNLRFIHIVVRCREFIANFADFAERNAERERERENFSPPPCWSDSREYSRTSINVILYLVDVISLYAMPRYSETQVTCAQEYRRN